jgi:HPt (histidine-containing phosphotransfer) domain-containing protein
LRGDDQACLDAGMDDFLAKPYSFATLHAKLSAWLPEAPDTQTAAAAAISTGAGTAADAPAANAAAPQAPPPGPSAHINARTIAMLREMDEHGGVGLLSQLLAAYEESSDYSLQRMSAALDEGDAKALRQLAHSLKSGAANLGADAVAACCRESEHRARNEELDAVRPLLAPMQAQQQLALGTLRAIIAEGVA